ncbi:hypothetical protein L6452_35572 [Arctium lappa]|uniref:Uncharacterized protein n=1 Tax=Arctium lappa TaxID=4217 RepID=A0ACB8Y7I5_ARCLA|nr:hypothetical protein L6452_35572 [Arctium lappa]
MMIGWWKKACSKVTPVKKKTRSSPEHVVSGKIQKPSGNGSEAVIKAEEALNSPIKTADVDQPLEKGIALNEGEGNYGFNIDQVRGGPEEVVGPVGINEAQVEEVVVGPDTKKPKVEVYGNRQSPIVEEVSEKSPDSTTLNRPGLVDNFLKENSPRCVKISYAKKLDVGNGKCDRRKT